MLRYSRATNEPRNWMTRSVADGSSESITIHYKEHTWIVGFPSGGNLVRTSCRGGNCNFFSGCDRTGECTGYFEGEMTVFSPTVTSCDGPPTAAPTRPPTRSPTAAPTRSPTAAPTLSPTAMPSRSPSVIPSSSPTAMPSDQPTAMPSMLADTISAQELSPTSNGVALVGCTWLVLVLIACLY